MLTCSALLNDTNGSKFEAGQSLPNDRRCGEHAMSFPAKIQSSASKCYTSVGSHMDIGSEIVLPQRHSAPSAAGAHLLI